VGREAELLQLRSAFNAAAEGHGGLVLLVGEPGIGKTALCEHFANLVVADGGIWLGGHCYEEGAFSLPYQPFVEAFGHYASDRDAGTLRDELGAGASDISRMVPSLQDLLKVPVAAPSDPRDDRWRLLNAVLGFVRRAGGLHPILLVLEDVHDADSGTVDLLLHLARNLFGTRMLIVATYRDIAVDRAHPLSTALGELSRIGQVGRIQLGGLGVEDIQRLLAATSRHAISRSLANVVHRRTEGNPLFAHEMLRLLAAEGLIELPAGSDHETRRGALSLPGHIPEGLRDVVGKRLARLSASTNQVLGIASVIGREFPLEVLRRVSAKSDEELELALEEATAAAIVEERSVVGPTVTYRFAHGFFRQTLYEEMLAPRRIRLHRSIARVLEDVYARRLDEHASELAEHYAFSSDMADLARAVEYAQLAARRATDVFAYGEAARQLERALHIQELVDPDERSVRCDLLLALGEALALSGDAQRAMAFAAPEALALAERLQDRHRAFRACRIALDSVVFQGAGVSAATPDFLQWADRADRFAEPESGERAAANVWLSLAQVMQDRLPEAGASRLEALAIARRTGDREMQFVAASYLLSMGRTAPQFWGERVRLARESVAWPREGVSGRAQARVLWYAGRLALAEGDRARAVECWRQIEELANRLHVMTAMLYVLHRDVILAFLDGRLEEAWLLLQQFTMRADDASASVRALALTFDLRLSLAIHLGLTEQILSVSDIQPFGAGDTYSVPMRIGGRALGLAAVGRNADARSVAGPFLDQAPGQTGESAWGETNPLLVMLQCAIALEYRDAAHALAARLESLAHVSLGDWIMTSPARQLGAAAALNGDRVAARRYYTQALEAAGKIGFRPDRALTHLQFAELLLDEGECAIALEHLHVAIPEFRDMKMQPALERALRSVELAKQPKITRRPRAIVDTPLTGRELDVARLVALGRTNREIADALVITEGTAEVHIKHILSKLGFRSRSQVASWVTQEQAPSDRAK
jgi:DNA-binding CsgD family transcriptional regulator